jgi:hypothetical protein
MDNNLIPPFILREAGLIVVNDKPKIHCASPTVNDHTIQDPETGLFIQLNLDGIFSFFTSRRPTHDDLLNAKAVVITPEGTSWNPHSEHFSLNEDTYTDYEGNMMNRVYIQNNLIDENDVPANAAIDCADVKAVLAAHYEASAKSDYSDTIGASISAVESASHILTTDCGSFENKVNNAAAISDFNSFHVIRNLPLRVTPIFANKNHALNTLKMGPLLRNNVMLP